VYLFQKSQEVVNIGTFALRAASIGALFLPISVSANMLYQSIRKAGIASFLSLLRSGLALIPSLLIFTNLFGLTGLQIAQPISDVISCLISLPFFILFLIKTPNTKEK
jgi:Na+-driven multidrug efflux pump